MRLQRLSVLILMEEEMKTSKKICMKWQWTSVAYEYLFKRKSLIISKNGESVYLTTVQEDSRIGDNEARLRRDVLTSCEL